MYTKASVLPIPSNLIENQMKRRKNSRNYIVNLRFFVLRRCLSNRVVTERQNLIGENDYIIFTTHQYHNVHAWCDAHPHNLWWYQNTAYFTVILCLIIICHYIKEVKTTFTLYSIEFYKHTWVKTLKKPKKLVPAGFCFSRDCSGLFNTCALMSLNKTLE